jgi:CubicO group peptidase (beta-lactamase class C family)
MKRFWSRILKLLLIVIVIILILPLAMGKRYLYKAVFYNFADIDDYTIFDNREVGKGEARPWKLAGEFGNIKMPDSLDRYLGDLKSVAVAVIKDRQLLFERYWDDYSDSSYSGSFSVAKSITSLLIGAAIHDKLIPSVQDFVGNYLAEFSTGPKAKVRIVDLLTMSSGSDWDESYSDPLSTTTELYYGPDLRKLATSVNIIRDPGTYHSYKSGDTELLGLIVEKATGKTLSQYASEKLWRPLGAEHPALWSIDSKGHEKAYCCFNTNARDFARLGQLMLDSGKINGSPVIDSDYFAKSVTPCMLPDDLGGTCDYYGYQWWMVPEQKDIFYARGILGQYIICIPSKKIVIVRLGMKRDRIEHTVPLEVRKLIAWGQAL